MNSRSVEQDAGQRQNGDQIGGWFCRNMFRKGAPIDKSRIYGSLKKSSNGENFYLLSIFATPKIFSI